MKHANSLKTQQQCLFCTCNSLQANQPQRRGNKFSQQNQRLIVSTQTKQRDRTSFLILNPSNVSLSLCRSCSLQKRNSSLQSLLYLRLSCRVFSYPLLWNTMSIKNFFVPHGKLSVNEDSEQSNKLLTVLKTSWENQFRMGQYMKVNNLNNIRWFWFIYMFPGRLIF